jgi:hypothetical protein
VNPIVGTVSECLAWGAALLILRVDDRREATAVPGARSEPVATVPR